MNISINTFFAVATAAAFGVSTAIAQNVPEAPSTVNATYVEASAKTALDPGQKVANLYNSNVNQDYVLQKLTGRVYWVQRQFYGTVFYVGDKGVLILDALEGRTAQIKQAIAKVTNLPITALLYSHNHADHIVDAKVMLSDNPDLRIIATERTAELLERLGSGHPKPTEIITDKFSFEGLTVDIVPMETSGHAHDHAIYVLEGTGVIHVPDVINPDQPPFWSFAGADSYLGYRDMIEAIGALEWDFLSGGHGNIGSRADVVFYRSFLNDLEAAAGQAMGEIPWGAGVENAAELNAHTAFMSGWISEVGKHATDILRPKYGDFYGFEYGTPRNAEMVALTFFSYR